MSTENDLISFLHSKAGAPVPKIDWEARKDNWLKNIAQFYDLIKDWLKPLENDKTVSYRKIAKTIEEEYLGSYQVEDLILQIGNQHVVFHPKGTLIVGANGRIDIQGQRSIRSIIEVVPFF